MDEYVCEFCNNNCKIKQIEIEGEKLGWGYLCGRDESNKGFRKKTQSGFDLLHAHTPVAALIGRMAARLAGVPLVVYTAHGFYFHDAMPAWKRRMFVEVERLGAWFTDILFNQSSEDAQNFQQAYLHNLDMLHFAYADTNPVAIKSLMQAIGLPAGPLRKPLQRFTGNKLQKGLDIGARLGPDKLYG